MKVWYVASEVAGFAKTGGLADVAGSLPAALAQRGIDCTVVMPLYRSARNSGQPLTATPHQFRIPIGDRWVYGRVWRSELPGSKVPLLLIDQPEFFDRDDPSLGQGIYQFTRPDGQRSDYPDNCARFVFFCRAVLETMSRMQDWPDVLHVNDWQTGLLPVYLKELAGKTPSPVRPKYQQIRTLFTIHNLAYQGTFWHLDMPILGLPWKLFHWEKLEFYGQINLLKAGIVYSDRISTVSPTYAREIQTPYFGCGLQSVLTQRSNVLSGIVNGVDYSIWNPGTDATLPTRYDATNVAAGKARCKAMLQESLGLESRPEAMVLGMVSRLATQKGLGLLEQIAPRILMQGVQLAVLGEGEKAYHEMLQRLRRQFPQQVGVHFGLSEPLAHLVEAGSDAFLMPSSYEPCGLNQLFSLKYGTPPIVRATGGLADTVTDATPQNLASGKATGFSFSAYTAEAFLTAIERAMTLFRDDRALWLQLQKTGMLQDWSWNRSAGDYEKIYRELREMV